MANSSVQGAFALGSTKHVKLQVHTIYLPHPHVTYNFRNDWQLRCLQRSQRCFRSHSFHVGSSSEHKQLQKHKDSMPSNLCFETLPIFQNILHKFDWKTCNGRRSILFTGWFLSGNRRVTFDSQKTDQRRLVQDFLRPLDQILCERGKAMITMSC